MVTEGEILKILKLGAQSTADIQRTTKAGTSCGRCLPTIDSIVEEFWRQQPDDLQQRINFDD
jgi:NAD(P)H-nitrite reductase large subunit